MDVLPSLVVHRARLLAYNAAANASGPTVVLVLHLFFDLAGDSLNHEKLQQHLFRSFQRLLSSAGVTFTGGKRKNERDGVWFRGCSELMRPMAS
jgi:hypothetical protein